MKKFLVAALLAGVASSAFAADLPTRKAPPPPPYAPPPIFSWTGFYAGVNGSYNWAQVQHNYLNAFGNPSGGMGGLTAGYNYQIGQFVTGIEGDYDWGDVSHKQGFIDGSSSKLNMEDFMTLRGRFGMAFDRALIFGTAGYAGGNVHGTYYDAPGNFASSTTKWENGYAVGAGIEYAFTNNISVKAEYLFSQLGNRGFFSQTPVYTRTGLDVSTIRAGVNYKFF